MTEPTLNLPEAMALIRAASAQAFSDVPEYTRKHRFRLILAKHGRVSVDEIEQVLDELMDAV